VSQAALSSQSVYLADSSLHQRPCIFGECICTRLNQCLTRENGSYDVDSHVPCRLLELPPELRLLIYEAFYDTPASGCLALTVVDADVMQYNISERTHIKKSPTRLVSALLCTSRAIHAEASPVFYKETPVFLNFKTKLARAPGRPHGQALNMWEMKNMPADYTTDFTFHKSGA
jgi:hypothetical protein